MNILLNYFFPITAISETPAASTAFLKQVCVVVSPNSETDGEPVLCTTMEQVAALTDNEEAEELFDAGMSRVYILPLESLEDLADAIDGFESDFYTILISSDFDNSDFGSVSTAAVKASKKIQDILYTAKVAGTSGNSITVNYDGGGTAGEATVSVSTNAITVVIEDGVTTAEDIADAINAHVDANDLVVALCDVGDEGDPQDIFGSGVALEDGAAAVTSTDLDVGGFTGVVGISETDDEFLDEQRAIENRCAFHTTAETKARNMFYAFGKLLSNSLDWLNQQFITMPHADDVDTLGEATNLFDSKISFVLDDDEFGKRLGLFVCGGKAIVAPYIRRNLELDLQSKALQYVSGNQPAYTKTQAALLEDELQKVVQSYIDRQWIEAGVVEVKLEQENFVASGYINIAEPKALWRVVGQIKQTL